MALALKDGDVWVFPRVVDLDEGLGVRVALAPGNGFAGPLTVTGWTLAAGGREREEITVRRCLGARTVMPGSAGAFFGCQEGAAFKISWRLPVRRLPDGW